MAGQGSRARASLPSMDGFLRDGIEDKCNTGGIGVRHCTINQSPKGVSSNKLDNRLSLVSRQNAIRSPFRRPLDLEHLACQHSNVLPTRQLPPPRQSASVPRLFWVVRGHSQRRGFGALSFVFFVLAVSLCAAPMLTAEQTRRLGRRRPRPCQASDPSSSGAVPSALGPSQEAVVC